MHSVLVNLAIIIVMKNININFNNAYLLLYHLLNEEINTHIYISHIEYIHI